MSVFNANSWLSNAKRRAKEGILQAMGQHISTEDQEFDTKLRNFNAHVTELQRLKQSMEVWLESFEVFCTSTQILSESWKTFHNRSPYRLAAGEPISPFQEVSAEVDKVMTDIHLHLQPAIHDIFKNRCLKPVTFILSLVPSIHEQIQQRKLLLLDFDSYKTKIQKEHAAGRDSSHPNVARKAVKLDESAKKLHSLQTTLSKTLDEFEIARPMTLGPELASYVACMHSFSASMYNSTSLLLPVIPQAVSTLAILDSQVTASKIYTDKLSSVKGTQSTIIHRSAHILNTVDPISVRPNVMGGSMGGYGESLHVIDVQVPILQSASKGYASQVMDLSPPPSYSQVQSDEVVDTPDTLSILPIIDVDVADAQGSVVLPHHTNRNSCRFVLNLSSSGTSADADIIRPDICTTTAVPPPKPPRRKFTEGESQSTLHELPTTEREKIFLSPFSTI